MKLNNTTFLKDVTNDWRRLTRPQKWLYFLYAILLVPYVLDFFRMFEIRLGLSFFTAYSDAFFIILAVLGSITVFIKKIRITDLVFIVSIVILYFISAYANTDTASFAFDSMPIFFGICLPLYLAGLTFDTKVSYNLFVVFAYVALFLQIIVFYFHGMGVDENGDERNELMGVAYAFLPFVCLLQWNAIYRRSVIHWVFAIIAVFLLFSMGTRGPIICFVLFVAIYIFFYRHYKRNVLVKALIGALVIVIYMYITEISIFFGFIAQQFGLSTRVFDSIVGNQMVNIQESSARDIVWSETIRRLIEQNTLFDFNLYNDRLFNGYDVYVHNLELELLCDFGLIGGTIIIALLFLLIFRAFKCSWKSNAAVLLIVFFTSSILELQFSGSFLILSVFWFFLGMCVTMMRNKIDFIAVPLKRIKKSLK